MFKSIFYLMLCLAILNKYNTNGLADNLFYNTTSGSYRAHLVQIDLENNENAKFVHKVEIPYGEKPERFKRSFIKKYVPGQHINRKPVVCFQSVHMTSYGLFNINDAPEMTEDCLTVTLYIPATKDPNETYTNMSLVVHIHGGSNMVGGAALFDGSILASHGKVVVAIINYRLSILGFLSDLTPEYPGNNGLRDQVLAIQWIKMNCQVLKCNPDSITLWGHSAGAGDVNLLALSSYSNHLFKRVIIQSGSAFSYWSYDKFHTERYKSYRTYFNCTHLPENVTNENKALSLLIKNCLMFVSLEKLFEFRYALIDSPGPINDAFLGAEDSLMNGSPKEMLDKANQNFYNIDILTGINRVEGYAFEGYFSSSVKNFRQFVHVPEVTLTLERYSLLIRDKCMQNAIIGNRLKLENYYEDKIKKPNEIKRTNAKKCHSSKMMTKDDENYINYAGRLKAIFANSDSIFDAGFIGFLKSYISLKTKLNEPTNSNLYVYEYLYENYGNKNNLNQFRSFMKENLSLSTHFDGIDLAFGLPVAYKLNLRNKLSTKGLKDKPFENFIFESPFSDLDIKLSHVMMTYFTNFIKTGNPNEDGLILKSWLPYSNNEAYFQINSDILSQKPMNSSNHFGIRGELYKFWHVELEKSGQCFDYNYYQSKQYESKIHSSGNEPALDKCFETLENSNEYNYLRENFLTEYETCMNTLEASASFASSPGLKNLFNTHCLDAIAIRRLLIEYNMCCNQNKSQIYSTICAFDINRNYLDKNVINLAETVLLATPNAANKSFKFNFLIILFIKIYILYKVY